MKTKVDVQGLRDTLASLSDDEVKDLLTIVYYGRNEIRDLYPYFTKKAFKKYMKVINKIVRHEGSV